MNWKFPISAVRVRQVVGAGVVLSVVGALIRAGFAQNSLPETETASAPIKSVAAYSLATAQNYLTTTGAVTNLQQIELVAQTAGPVRSLPVTVGQSVKKGALLAQFSTAYNTGSAASVQRQIAEKNLDLAKKSLESTVTSVSLARTQADKQRDNAEELRKISDRSLEDIRNLISLSEKQLSSLEKQLKEAEDNNQAESTLSSLRGSIISVQSGLSSSRSQLRSLEYQASDSSPARDLTNVTRDAVYTSTQLQLESAEIQTQIAELSLKAARISEATTQVRAPFAGIIERLDLKIGQYVTPGTLVAVLRGTGAVYELKVLVATSVAPHIELSNHARISITDDQTGLPTELSAPITHVSSTAVQNGLAQVVLHLDHAQFSTTTSLTEGAIATVHLPLKNTAHGELTIIPLQAVFSSADADRVLLIDDSTEGITVVSREITIGQIFGQYTTVLSGLTATDVLVLDRTVAAGDTVTIKSQ
jgi:RND family efflux transporter MFP subunit